MRNQEWVEITEKEFEELLKKAVKQHTIGFCDPPIRFYWDEEGAKNSDLSFGQHAFLKLEMNMSAPEYLQQPNTYWRSK